MERTAPARRTETSESNGAGDRPALAWHTATAVLVAGFAYLWLIRVVDDDFYFLSVQEDQYLEWATFWSFVAAAGFFCAVLKRTGSPLSMRLAGPVLAIIFCFFLAFEEISWGQRLIGFQPPLDLLESNFQLELNYHNAADVYLRWLLFALTILVPFVIYPLAGRAAVIRRAGTWLGMPPPPAGLVPAGLLLFILHFINPWAFAQEIIELLLGLLFCFYSLALSASGPDQHVPGQHVKPRHVLVLVAAVIGLGFLSSYLTGLRTDDQGARLARDEITRLTADIGSTTPAGSTACGLDKRLYTMARDHGWHGILNGTFAKQTADPVRAGYLLDPWNMPYWVRHACTGGSDVLVVYSFGPNRRRDSGRHVMRPDDLHLTVRGAPPP